MVFDLKVFYVKYLHYNIVESQNKPFCSVHQNIEIIVEITVLWIYRGFLIRLANN